MKPLRRHLIGLPLQRSMFSAIDRAPEILGMRGVIAGDRIRAWLNEEGDLFLDQADVEQLTAALPRRLTPDHLAFMERSLAAACGAVLDATERCARRAPVASDAEARALAGELGAHVTELIPYGVMTKFVPDALYRLLAPTSSDTAPPIPRESAGAALTRAAAALCAECRAAGFTPARLRAEWPGVPEDVAAIVRAFSRAHAGFGPLQWEAPGCENPEYVIGLLGASFGDDDPAATVSHLAAMAARRSSDPGSSDATRPGIRRVLALWLEFLERETWYVRRAFHVGLLPLLRRLMPARRPGVAWPTPDAILFLELADLAAASPDWEKAAARRTSYFAQSAYLAEHGITAGQLTAILEAA